MADWRNVTLPDGRRVEYVDTVPVEWTDSGLLCDVTVTVDGLLNDPIPVVVPMADALAGLVGSLGGNDGSSSE